MEMLADHDGFPASDIHNQFQSSPQAISQHLKILREANLVHVEKKAQQRIYRINTEARKTSPADFPINIEFVIEFIANGAQTELRITEYGWTVGEMMK